MTRRAIILTTSAGLATCAVLAWLVVRFVNHDPEMYDLGHGLADRIVAFAEPPTDTERACTRLFETQKAADAEGRETFVGINWESSTGRSSFIDGCVDALREAR